MDFSAPLETPSSREVAAVGALADGGIVGRGSTVRSAAMVLVAAEITAVAAALEDSALADGGIRARGSTARSAATVLVAARSQWSWAALEDGARGRSSSVG